MRKIEIEENPVQLLDVKNGIRLILSKVQLRRNLFAVGMLLVVLLCLCFWCLTGDTSWGIGFFVSLGLLLTWGYRPIIYLPYIYPRKYHEQLTSFGKLSTIIDDCGILEKSDSAQVFHKWDSVIKHMEDQNGFVIFFSTQNLKYIPKRLLNGEEEKELKEELHVRQGTGVGRPKGRK